MSGQELSSQETAYAPRYAEDSVHQASLPDGRGSSSREALGGLSKRLFHVLVTSVAVIFLMPVIILIARIVRACDGGPALHRHQRMSLGVRRFACLKFRSMRVDSERVLEAHLAASPAAAREWALYQKLRSDPRVTPAGRFLRKTSLDALPQLFNILLGEMSLVGPRPIVPSELERDCLASVHYLRARPGLTGLWQISGRALITHERRIELDCEYVNRWRFLSDVSIILRTLPALLFRGGAI